MFGKGMNSKTCIVAASPMFKSIHGLWPQVLLQCVRTSRHGVVVNMNPLVASPGEDTERSFEMVASPGEHTEHHTGQESGNVPLVDLVI